MNEPNPIAAILLYVLGGLAGAVFYLPFKKVKNWAWESYWLVYAVAGLVLVPWVLAFIVSPKVCGLLSSARPQDAGPLLRLRGDVGRSAG